MRSSRQKRRQKTKITVYAVLRLRHEEIVTHDGCSQDNHEAMLRPQIPQKGEASTFEAKRISILVVF